MSPNFHVSPPLLAGQRRLAGMGESCRSAGGKLLSASRQTGPLRGGDGT